MGIRVKRPIRGRGPRWIAGIGKGSGYTLMEILAIISIVAAVASIALPNGNTFFSAQRAAATAKTFLSDARLGRFEAIRTGQPHRLVMSNLLTQNTYQVQVLALSLESGITTSQFNDNANWFTVLDEEQRTLDPETVISTPRTSTIFFTPQGKLVEDWVWGMEEAPLIPRPVSFNFNNATMTVTLNSFGGFSSVAFYEEE